MYSSCAIGQERVRWGTRGKDGNAGGFLMKRLIDDTFQLSIYIGTIGIMWILLKRARAIGY